MRQKHEVRCEMYEQGRREYNERMGIEEGQEGEEKVESDEDFQPDEGQGSDDQGEVILGYFKLIVEIGQHREYLLLILSTYL